MRGVCNTFQITIEAYASLFRFCGIRSATLGKELRSATLNGPRWRRFG